MMSDSPNAHAPEIAFLRSASYWVCDGYYIDMRYVAIDDVLLDAAISLWPLPHAAGLTFQVETESLRAGHLLFGPVSKTELLETLSSATQGSITVGGNSLCIAAAGDHQLAVESETDPWFSPLHLTIVSGPSRSPAPAEATRIDASLRANALPFDGLDDLTVWLGLSTSKSQIRIRVAPPVDLIFAESRFADDRFHATLHAHPQFDVAQIGLAVRGVPGDGLRGRKQVAQSVTWSHSANLNVGTLDVELPNSNSVLTMLSLRQDLVRRQWFADPRKAPSARFISLRHFDAELRMVRTALFEGTDARKFEQAVSLVFFMLGFSSALPVELNSPDMVVFTPGGQTVVVECTTRLADIVTKCGKLVERRASLSKALAAANLPAAVQGVLVCRLPKDEIAAARDTPFAHQLLLIAREEIESALHRAQFVVDPDGLLREWQASTSSLRLTRDAI